MWFIDTVEFLLMHRAGQASGYALSDSMHEEIVTLVWHCVTIAVIMSHIVLYYIFIFLWVLCQGTTMLYRHHWPWNKSKEGFCILVTSDAVYMK